MSDKEWISADLLNLLISRVWAISMRNDARDDSRISFLAKEKRLSYVIN